MKRNKLLNVLLSTSMLATTLTVLPLCSCSNTSSHVRLSELSKSSQTLDENNQVKFYLVLDSKDYKDVKVSFDGESQGFSLEYSQNGDILAVTLKFLSRVNEDTTFDIKFKIQTSNWTDTLFGLKVFVKSVAEQETVDQIDNVLSQYQKPATMSACIELLNKKAGIDLEALTTTNKTSQWVWDCDQNKVFVLNDNGTIKVAPKGYTLNSYNVNIWKMVGGNQTFRLNSAKNDSVNIDSFSTNCKYSQYLRSDAQFSDKSLIFHTGLDTGSHTGFELTFEKDETLTATQPAAIINTNKSSLTVNSELNDIEHHGNLTTLTIEKLPDESELTNGTYTEFGTVDARVVLSDGAIVAESGSSINDVVITSDDVTGVKVEANAVVGTVVVTTDVQANAEDFVDDTEATTEVDTSKPKQNPDPEQARYSGGFGTKNSPYAIENKTQLFYCAQDVNSATLSESNCLYFKVIADINLDNNEWTPIGNSNNKFYGVFDGNNYTISNLKITSCPRGKGYGLFGWTGGKKNTVYGITEQEKSEGVISRDKVWDRTTNTLIEDTISEDKYKTIIKNVSIENVDVQFDTIDDIGCVGGIVGAAENTYISNCQVKTGVLKACKAVGGIAGTFAGSVINECTSGNNEGTLQIVAGNHNIGGIVGTTDYATSISGTNVAIVKCQTTPNCSITVEECDGGATGGIVSYSENVDSLVVEGCTNYANIVSQNTSSSEDAKIGGIAGHGNHVGLIANSINKGSITVSGESYAENVGGIISCPGQGTILYNCVNYGDISANASNSVAGVAAGCNTSGLPTHVDFELFEMNSCTNEAENISNTLYPDKKSDICDAIIGIQFVGTTFANTDEISNMIKRCGSTKTQVTFKNCTLLDPSGSLTLPSNVATIYADNTICNNITVNNNFSEINIYVPNQNITITQQSNCVVNSYSENNTITIAQSASVKSVKVCGAGSKIINNGEVKGTIEVSGKASESTNNGTCRNVRFGNSTDYIQQDVSFTNNGTIKCVGDSSLDDNNVISVNTLISRPNITIKNYGTIEYQNNGLATPGNFISYDILQGPGYLWNYGQVTLECYANSQTITDTHNFFDLYSSLLYSYCYATLKSQSGSTINDNGLTTFSQIQDYYKNTVETPVHITVEEI